MVSRTPAHHGDGAGNFIRTALQDRYAGIAAIACDLQRTSIDVFKDPYYLSVRGMGEWLTLIDRRYYKRNLFSGLDRAPQVADNAVMLVADRERAEGAIAGVAFTWLKCEGIDRSTPYRGLAVIAAAALPALDATVAVYRAASPRMTPPAR